jgi:hypothetical protein
MTTLIEIRGSNFDAKVGTFRTKGLAALVAALVAARIHKFLDAQPELQPFDSRNVVVNGKHEYTIEFPRIRHVWWPKTTTDVAIQDEMVEVCNLFKEHNTK